MKIIIAPDSFKESLSALAVADAIEAGFKDIFPNATYVKIPFADGGEGTTQTLVDATAGRLVECTVSDPLLRPIQATYGLTGDGQTAIIEVASASGLNRLTPAERNPLLTSSFGTGELIRAALDAGARHFILGIGGSATNDGGMGLLQALGVQFFDAQGQPLTHGGGALAQLQKIDVSTIDPRLADCQFDVACDVDNPLIGAKGASAVFGPQKGATPEMVLQLDHNLRRLAHVIERDLHIDVAQVAGTGAGGGLGAAALVFLGGRLRAGCEIVAQAVQLEQAIAAADLVITGEGRMDSQTLHGKTAYGVAQIAQRCGKPVLAIAGSLSEDHGVIYKHGVDAAFSAVQGVCTLETAYAQAAFNIQSTARNVAAVLRIGQGLQSKH